MAYYVSPAGDLQRTAGVVAAGLGLDADHVHAQLLPSDKLELVKLYGAGRLAEVAAAAHAAASGTRAWKGFGGGRGSGEVVGGLLAPGGAPGTFDKATTGNHLALFVAAAGGEEEEGNGGPATRGGAGGGDVRSGWCGLRRRVGPTPQVLAHVGE
jgi:hypothetical protein